MSLGLNFEILALPLRHQGPGSQGRRKTLHSTAPSSAGCLGLWEQTGTLETKKGAVGGGLSPPSARPWCLMLREAPAGCLLPVVPHPHASSEWSSPGPAFLLGGQRVKGTDVDRSTPLHWGLRYKPLPSPATCLGPPCPSSQPRGRDPPTLQRGQGIPLPLVPSPLTSQSSLAHGEVGWALLS